MPPSNDTAYKLEAAKILKICEELWKSDSKPNIKHAAFINRVDYQKLYRAFKGGANRSTRTPSNQRLDETQEKALKRFLDHIDSIGFGIKREMVRDAANSILAQDHIQLYGDDDLPPRVGTHWPTRYLGRSEFSSTKAKPIETARKRAMNPEYISGWFSDLLAYCQEHGIIPDDFWNFDECGVCIGVARNQLVWTRKGRQIFIPHSNSRELVTLVETVRAGGESIPPMIIIAAKNYAESWFEDLPAGYLVARSDSGYSNDELALAYVKHFHKMTKGSIQGRNRLLLMDGYGSHNTFEVITYAGKHGIFLYGLPAHTTHFLQPLDVGCFQPLKHYHGQILDTAARYSGREFTRTEFLAALAQIRQLTFKPRTIIGAWQKTGLAPWNPELVVSWLRTQEVTAAPEPTATYLEERLLEGPASPDPPSEHPSDDDLDQEALEIALKIRAFNKAVHGRVTPEPPDLAGPEWKTPITIRTLKRQSDVLLRLDLPQPVFEAVQTTLKGARIQSYNATLFKNELLKTNAATAAFNSRKSRSRRVVQTGGPLYAEEARRMKKQRTATDAAAEFEALKQKHKDQEERAFNKYKEDVLPAYIKFYWKDFHEVYKFRGDDLKAPAQKVWNCRWKDTNALGVLENQYMTVGPPPAVRKAYIRWIMGPLTKVGAKRVAKMVEYAKARMPRVESSDEDDDVEDFNIDLELE